MKSSDKVSAYDSIPFFSLEDEEDLAEVKNEENSSPATTITCESTDNETDSFFDSILFFPMEEEANSSSTTPTVSNSSNNDIDTSPTTLSVNYNNDYGQYVDLDEQPIRVYRETSQTNPQAPFEPFSLYPRSAQSHLIIPNNPIQELSNTSTYVARMEILGEVLPHGASHMHITFTQK